MNHVTQTFAFFVPFSGTAPLTLKSVPSIGWVVSTDGLSRYQVRGLDSFGCATDVVEARAHGRGVHPADASKKATCHSPSSPVDTQTKRVQKMLHNASGGAQR